jgi:hypothetical protein
MASDEEWLLCLNLCSHCLRPVSPSCTTFEEKIGKEKNLSEGYQNCEELFLSHFGSWGECLLPWCEYKVDDESAPFPLKDFQIAARYHEPLSKLA